MNKDFLFQLFELPKSHHIKIKEMNCGEETCGGDGKHIFKKTKKNT